MSISSPGIGSGLDIAGLVSQLVAAEGAPVQFRLDRDEANVQGRISAYGLIKSALSEFQSALEPLTDFDSLQGRSITLENEQVFTATAGSESVRGSYAIEVQSLASSQKLRSSAFAGLETVVGTGTLTISSGSNAFAVVINEPNNTLADVRDAINEAATNTGVLATVVSSVDGDHLVLTSAEAGADKAITVKSTGGDGGLDALVYDPVGGTTNLTEVDAAADARILVDGLVVESNSNSVSNAIEGVTIDLLKADVGTTYQLSIGLDQDNAKEQIRGFVDAYNNVVATLNDLTNFDAENLVGGPLLGDTTTRSIVSALRNTIGDFVNSGSSFRSLAEIGITTELDGRLTIDDSVLDERFATEFGEVGRLFSSDGGYAKVLDELVDSLLASDGQIESRLEGLNTDIEDIADQRESLARRLESVEARLFVQFNALDTLVAELNSTSSFLNQQLGSLPGFTTPNGG